MTADTVLPNQIFYVNRKTLQDYAEVSGDHNPIHLDEEFARSVGLPNVIAHGMLTMALAAEAIRRWADESFSVTDFSTRFTKPVVVPAGTDVALIFSAAVISSDENELVFEVTALCNGVKVLGQTKARLTK